MQDDSTLPEGAVRVPLRRRDGSIRAYAIVDAIDAEWVLRWRWCLCDGYARRLELIGGKWTPVRLHRAILGLAPDDEREGDHINRDRLDCRRSNLRALPVAKRPNMQNVPARQGYTSPHRGVSWDRTVGKWRAKVVVDKVAHHIGYFASEDDAAWATQEARARLMPFATD